MSLVDELRATAAKVKADREAAELKKLEQHKDHARVSAQDTFKRAIATFSVEAREAAASGINLVTVLDLADSDDQYGFHRDLLNRLKQHFLAEGFTVNVRRYAANRDSERYGSGDKLEVSW